MIKINRREKMKRNYLLLISLFLLTIISCSAPSPSPNNNPFANSPVEVVPWEQLIETLPEDQEVSGWSAMEPKGETTDVSQALPTSDQQISLKFTKVENEYWNADEYVRVTIIDTSFLLIYTQAWNIKVDRESSSGYTRSTEINGQPAFEEWNSASEQGTITMFVGERMLVEVSGMMGVDIDTVRQFAEAVDVDEILLLI